MSPDPNLGTIENRDVAELLIMLSEAPDFLSRSWQRKVESVSSMLWGRELLAALSEMDDA
jgi:hypothetical protein